MSDASAEKRVVVYGDPVGLADAVATRFVQRLVRHTEGGKPMHVSLTGGSMGGAVLAAVREHPRVGQVNWRDVHIWWSDERFVASDSPDRNEVQARSALLDHLDVPPANIHAMAASDGIHDLDSAADAYARELAQFGTPDEPWPSFDVCFLGVGPDGHIASLFPDRPEILVTDRVALAVRNSPKPPPERVTLTRPVINASKRVWLVMTGADKASALGLALAGASYPSVPAAGAKGRRRTVFFVDAAAAAEVPPDLIDPDY